MRMVMRIRILLPIIIILFIFNVSNGEIFVKNCEELKNALTDIMYDNVIIITANLRCTRQSWANKVYITSHFTIRGSKFTGNAPSLDWSDVTDIITLAPNVEMTMENMIIIQDFMSISSSLSFSFIRGEENSKLNILGVGIAIRTCSQSLIYLESQIQNAPRTKRDNEQVMEKTLDGLYLKDVYYNLENNAISYSICGSYYQCDVTSPQDVSFLLALQSDNIRSYCNNGDNMVSLTSGIVKSENENIEDGSIEMESTSNMGIVVALTAVSTILITSLLFVIILKILIPCFSKSKPSPKVKSKKDKEDGNIRSAGLRDEELGESPVSNGGNKKIKKDKHITKIKKDNILKEMTLTDIEMGVPLGKGDNGTVYKGYYRDIPLALKVIDIDGKSSILKTTEIIQNYMIDKIIHNNLVKTYLYENLKFEDICNSMHSTEHFENTLQQVSNNNNNNNLDDIIEPIKENKVIISYRTFVVMEFCNMGSLSKAIRNQVYLKRDGMPKWSFVLRSAFDISIAIDYLHSKHIVHGDLKPENILMRGDASDSRGFICKVGDFSLSRFINEPIVVETDVYRTVGHMAPELAESGMLGKESDIFSFGILLLKLITRKDPYEYLTHNEIIKNTIEGIRPEIPSHCPKAYARLIKDCWHENYKARPPFELISERLARMVSEFGALEMESPRTLKLNHEEKEDMKVMVDTNVIHAGSNDVSAAAAAAAAPMEHHIFNLIRSVRSESAHSTKSEGCLFSNTFSFQSVRQKHASFSQDVFISSPILDHTKVKHESLSCLTIKDWSKVTPLSPLLQDNNIKEEKDIQLHSSSLIEDDLLKSDLTPDEIIKSFDSLPNYIQEEEEEALIKDEEIDNKDIKCKNNSELSKPSPTVSLRFGIAENID